MRQEPNALYAAPAQFPDGAHDAFDDRGFVKRLDYRRSDIRRRGSGRNWRRDVRTQIAQQGPDVRGIDALAD